jgi:hypothetical protein
MKILNRYTGALILEIETLTGAYLTRADLTGANLFRANLTGADLTGANLFRADLTRADLTRANLTGAYLSDADLTGANLTGAYLTRADLTGADLSDADLTGADLFGANLTGANLFRAYLTGADLTGANLKDVKNFPPISILPEGDIIGYKKASGGIVKVLIPKDAKRVNSTGRKCRAEFVDVLEISNGKQKVTGDYDHETVYEVGKRTFPDSYDSDFRLECSNGIHFFITKEEAEKYS